MEKKKVLFIFQEITPYLPESEKSTIGRYLPQGIQERGKEIRTFMPRYGCVNERRNQLHEVIRLSGMNLVINDTDHPLIIKVASIQAARMQVYFIDNEDYFHRKYVMTDKNDEPFEDNDERAIFFARGVLETVIKLRWAPDVIHCHGWFGSIVPILIKKTFADDPLFVNSKVVLSVYNDEFDKPFKNDLINKVQNDEINKEDVKILSTPAYSSLYKLGIQYSDGIIKGSPTVSAEIEEILKTCGKPVLEFQNEETYMDAFNDFYDKILMS
ncbi:MAG TPA: glycogen/starch synthase [Prolixibacteraceae bacterium]|nr:glycogen/starch synthase [Prolixibacteraceae bacterium]HPS12181.1 glycogen/starch synthase [Prolixibacteraceae bacterium]